MIERTHVILTNPDYYTVPQLEVEPNKLVDKLYGLKETEFALVDGRGKTIICEVIK